MRFYACDNRTVHSNSIELVSSDCRHVQQFRFKTNTWAFKFGTHKRLDENLVVNAILPFLVTSRLGRATRGATAIDSLFVGRSLEVSAHGNEPHDIAVEQHVDRARAAERGV